MPMLKMVIVRGKYWQRYLLSMTYPLTLCNSLLIQPDGWKFTTDEIPVVWLTISIVPYCKTEFEISSRKKLVWLAKIRYCKQNSKPTCSIHSFPTIILLTWRFTLDQVYTSLNLKGNKILNQSEQKVKYKVKCQHNQYQCCFIIHFLSYFNIYHIF